MPGYDPVARTQAANAALVAGQAIELAQEAQAQATSQSWQVVNSNTTALNGAHLSVDTSVQPVTILLPADGASAVLRDNAGTWGTHAVTVVGNGAPIGDQATFALDVSGYQVAFDLIGGVWRYTLQFLNGAV